MVAITVVLAATAFVLVADVGGESTKPVLQIGLEADDVNDRLEVKQAGPNANWKRVTLLIAKDDGVGSIFVGNSVGVIDQPADLSGLELVGDRVDITDDSIAMTGGQVLFFCRDGGGEGLFEVQIFDEETNGIAGATYTFGELAGCPTP